MVRIEYSLNCANLGKKFSEDLIFRVLTFGDQVKSSTMRLLANSFVK
jgi:hypothetical protein